MSQRNQVQVLTEGALMVALATVLSLLKIYELPWGGSITLLSMLPITVFSIRHGIKKGLLISFVYALLQMFLDLGKVIGWGLSPQTLAACLLLDYLAAFTVVGIAGIFRKHDFAGWIGGTVIAVFCRFAVHFISGVWLWHSFGELWKGFYTENTFIYSFLYNGSYMLPEMIFTVVGSIVLFQLPQTKNLLFRDMK